MLDTILGSKTKVRVLRTMVANDREYWLSELSRKTGLSTGALYPALEGLADTRVLKTRKAGRSWLYSLNGTHILIDEVRALFTAERERPAELARTFVTRMDKRGVRNIILFGSAVRGEYTETSDIDLLIVHEEEEEDIRERVSADANRMLDENDVLISLTCLTLKELRERLDRFDSFVLTVLNEGELLYGDVEWQRS